MLKLLKGGECYAPEYIGKKDVAVACDKIFKVEEHIPEERLYDAEIIDCEGMLVCPGFIDQHLHITGGGGENGPASRIAEISVEEIVSAGVSTVVGLLGMDSITRGVAGLLAKARGLEKEGVNTFIYTGSYGVPTESLTGKVINDLVYIDKVIGVGEIAIADYRSSHPSVAMLKELAWEARVGGMMGGKAGVLHIHVGDGKKGIEPLLELINDSDFPKSMFVPTHLNRNADLFNQAVEFGKNGGNVDLTAGEKTGKGYSVPDAMERLLAAGVVIDRITVSSDGNGSMPSEDGSGLAVGSIMELFNDIRSCMLEKKIGLETALKAVTVNVARLLGIHPQKGIIKAGSDADLLVLDKHSLEIRKMLIGGRLVMDGSRLLIKSTYK